MVYMTLRNMPEQQITYNNLNMLSSADVWKLVLVKSKWKKYKVGPLAMKNRETINVDGGFSDIDVYIN